MKKRINIAMIVDDLMIGGWTTLASLIPLFSDRFEIHVICLFGKGAFADELEAKGIKIHFFNFKKRNFPLKFFSLVRFLKTHDIEIVHTHLELSHIIGQSAAIVANIAHRIMHMHSVEKPPSGLYGTIRKSVTRRAAMVIPVSHSSQVAFENGYPHYDKKRIKIVCNAIDTKEFQKHITDSTHRRSDFGIDKDAFLFATVANLRSIKGHRYLVDAAKQLPNNVHFLLVGSGPEESTLKEQIDRANLEERFYFLGQRRDIPELLSLANAFVLPSISESFAICLLEALAVGLPCVVSDTGGIPEIIAHEENGLLAEPGNCDELAKAMYRIYSDNALREKLSKSGVEHVIQHYDIYLNLQKYEQLYTSLSEQANLLL